MSTTHVGKHEGKVIKNIKKKKKEIPGEHEEIERERKKKDLSNEKESYFLN